MSEDRLYTWTISSWSTAQDYAFFTGKADFDTARQRCISQGMTLATPKTQSQFNQLKKAWKKWVSWWDILFLKFPCRLHNLFFSAILQIYGWRELDIVGVRTQDSTTATRLKEPGEMSSVTANISLTRCFSWAIDVSRVAKSVGS